MYTWICLTGVVSLLLAGMPFANALPPFQKVAWTLYSAKPGSAVVSSGCKLCHAASGPPKLNPYGADVQSALQAAKTKTLTPEMLQSVEGKDSDGDGITNAAEFMADTLPGDPASHAAAAAPPDNPKTTPPVEANPKTNPTPDKTLATPKADTKAQPNATAHPGDAKPTTSVSQNPKAPDKQTATTNPAPMPKQSDAKPTTAGPQIATTQQTTPATVPPTAPVVAAATPTTASPADTTPGPWSLQALFLPSHAQHPLVVHFPIALLLIGLFFDALGIRTKNRALIAAGYYNISAAAAFAPITVLTGLGAWWFKYAHMTLEGNILYHLIMGIVSMLVIWGLWFLRRGEMKGETMKFRTAYIALGVLAFPIISITGHLGGILTSGQ